MTECPSGGWEVHGWEDICKGSWALLVEVLGGGEENNYQTSTQKEYQREWIKTQYIKERRRRGSGGGVGTKSSGSWKSSAVWVHVQAKTLWVHGLLHSPSVGTNKLQTLCKYFTCCFDSTGRCSQASYYLLNQHYDSWSTSIVVGTKVSQGQSWSQRSSDCFCGKAFMKYKGWDKLYDLYKKYLANQFCKFSQINYVVWHLTTLHLQLMRMRMTVG